MPKVVFPHMLKDEVEIWKRFRQIDPIPFLKLDYDVHVGTLPSGLGPLTPEMESLARAIYRKRIDVVGETEDEVWIIEIKPRAGMSTLGQLISYEALYEKEFSPTKPIRLAVVCERTEQDMEDLLVQYGIDIYQV